MRACERAYVQNGLDCACACVCGYVYEDQVDRVELLMELLNTRTYVET